MAPFDTWSGIRNLLSDLCGQPLSFRSEGGLAAVVFACCSAGERRGRKRLGGDLARLTTMLRFPSGDDCAGIPSAPSPLPKVRTAADRAPRGERRLFDVELDSSFVRRDQIVGELGIVGHVSHRACCGGRINYTGRGDFLKSPHHRREKVGDLPSGDLIDHYGQQVSRLPVLLDKLAICAWRFDVSGLVVRLFTLIATLTLKVRCVIVQRSQCRASRNAGQ